MIHKFYLFLILILLFSGCNNESNHTENNISLKKIKIVTLDSTQKKIYTIKEEPPKEYTFIFEDLQQQKAKITMKNDIYNFSNITQPIVMVTLFASWCPPCRGQIPHLTNLQKKFKKHLFILGALVYDDREKEALNRFIISEQALFFISVNQKENLKFANMITPKLRLKKDFPMPLMILFFKGKYFTHYEGSMPEEMIQSDIEQLLIKIKKGQ